MKHILTVVLALTLGGAAFAADEKPATQDSPMVAAAKRANRKGKKPANVITNETLNKTGAGAHVTTAASQRPIVLPKDPPAPTPEMVANQKRDEEKRRLAAQAVEQKKAAEERERALAAAAAAVEEGTYENPEHDPAEAEKTQEDANRKPPQR
jgi:hypothetical protein